MIFFPLTWDPMEQNIRNPALPTNHKQPKVLKTCIFFLINGPPKTTIVLFCNIEI